MIFRILLGQHTCRGLSLIGFDYVNVNVQFLYMYL